MLNHVWLALVVIGILTAAGRDAYDASTRAYANGAEWDIGTSLDPVRGTSTRATIVLAPWQLRTYLPALSAAKDSAVFGASITMHGDATGTVVLTVGDAHPPVFRAMAESQGNQGSLLATVSRGADGRWRLVFAPVSFVHLKKITIAAFDAAGTAVQIAIGLIGIMALWLGVMNVAEQAGLITVLARAVRPVTVRLFPDIPHDHPAIGAILMNVSANMLGLGNAATPFGLKAMEDLNTLNRKAGVATDAMVTFLAMNTSCVTLIPATAIAVRASMGSGDPAAIIGTTLLASMTATIAGVTVARALRHVRMFRFDTSEAR